MTAPKSPSDGTGSANELSFFKRNRLVNCVVTAFAGGMLFAAALPPLNWWWAGFLTLAPLVWCAARLEWKKAALCGWFWGLGWSVFAYQFLREIELPVPFLLAPVISLWPAVSAAVISAAGRNILFPAEVRSEPFEQRRDYLQKQHKP